MNGCAGDSMVGVLVTQWVGVLVTQWVGVLVTQWWVCW